MAKHSHVKVYIHLIWGTYRRDRVLTREVRLKLFGHFVERFKELDLTVEKMNIQCDHLHILHQLPLDRALPDIPKNLKGESSYWLNEQRFLPGKFQWQRGYGAFSVSASLVDTVKKYIENQDEHHKRKAFVEEYQEWAAKYGVWEDDDEI